MPLTPMSQFKARFISIMIVGSLFYSPDLLSFSTRDQFARAVLKSIFDSYRGSRLSGRVAPWKQQLEDAVQRLTSRSGRFRAFSPHSQFVLSVKGDLASPERALQFVTSRRTELPAVISGNAKPSSLVVRSANHRPPTEWSRMIAYFMEREAEMLPLGEWRQARFLIERGGSDGSLDYLRNYYLAEIERWVGPLLEVDSVNALSDIRKLLQEIGDILKSEGFPSYKITKIEEVVSAIQRMEGRSPHREVLIKIKQTLMNFKILCDAEERGFGWVGNLRELGIADDLWWAELRYGSLERKKLAVIVLIEEEAIQRGRIGFHVLKKILEWPDVEFRKYLSHFIIQKERVPQDMARAIEALALQSTQYLPGEAKFNETISTMALMLVNPRMEEFGAILGRSIQAKKSGEAHFIVQKIAAIRALGMLETESALRILMNGSYDPIFYSDLEAFPLLFQAYIDEMVSLSLIYPSKISQFLRGMYSGLKKPELRRGVASALGRIYAGSDHPEVARMFLQMLNEESKVIVKAELIFALSKLSFSDEALKIEVFKKVFSKEDLSVEICLAETIFRLRQGHEIYKAQEFIIAILNNWHPRFPFSHLYRRPSEPSVTTLLLEFQRQPYLFKMSEINRGLLELLSKPSEDVSDKIKIEVLMTYARYGEWKPLLGFPFDKLSPENKRRLIEAAFSSETIDPPTFRKMIEKAFSLYDKDLQMNVFQLLRDRGVAVDQKLKIVRNDLADTGRLYDALHKKWLRSENLRRNSFMEKAINELAMQ